MVVAILAKDKAHCLPLYLKCLESQTFPKEKIHLYVRTNNNNDDTAAVLRAWLELNGEKYQSVFFDDSNVDDKVQSFGQHEWNETRFKVLAKIRNDSVEHARKLSAHYFVADCDNFIRPYTLQALIDSGMPVVGPLLHRANFRYANYHNVCDANGYYAENPMYDVILNSQVKGLIQVDVVHCTYLVRFDYLRHVNYMDSSKRHEYVIFSDNLRTARVPQYIDNRVKYGDLTFAETREALEQEPWYHIYA